MKAIFGEDSLLRRASYRDWRYEELPITMFLQSLAAQSDRAPQFSQHLLDMQTLRPTQTYRIRICIFTRSTVIPIHIEILKALL
jgi:hypothetical protein